MIHQVVDKFIVELQVQLDQKGVSLEVSQEARDWLATKGYDRAMGARPMGRVIQDNLKNRWRTNCCLARWSTVVRSLSLWTATKIR